MKFKQIFIEEAVKDSPFTQKILSRYVTTPQKVIRKVEDIFGRVKKKDLPISEDNHFHPASPYAISICSVGAPVDQVEPLSLE